MLWAFVAVASIELVVVHLLVALWRPRVALILSALSLLSIAWLVGVIRSFGRLPVLIDDDRLVMRVGTLKHLVVPRGHVKGLRAAWDGATFKRPGAVKLSLLAYPNVVVEIDPPIAGWRAPVSLVGHRLDDPVGFAQALTRWLDAPSLTHEREAVAPLKTQVRTQGRGE